MATLRWIATLTLLLCLLAGTVSAVSYRDIVQGDTVTWHENVSLSRVIGWSDTVAWWHTNHTPGISPPDLVLTIDRPRTVFIDPHGFPQGDYYKWDGKWERAGNNLAFSVAITPRAPKATPTPSPSTPTERPLELRMPSLLPALQDKHIADILICRGHPTSILCRNTSSLWIFGHTQWAYLTPSPDGTYTLTSNLTSAFPPGNYTLIFQDPGKNGVQEVIFNPDKKEVWFNNLRTFDVTKTPITGWIPAQIQDLVLSSIDKTDDGTTVKILAIQDPTIDIKHLYDAGANFVAVNGYTNVPDGTPINIEIDPIRVLIDNGGSTITTTADQPFSPGSLRIWQAKVPINWNTTAPGRHFLTAMLPSGAFQTVSFWIYNIPDGQTRPQGFVHYLSGNEFESSATVKTIEIVRTVEVPVYIQGPASTPITPPVAGENATLQPNAAHASESQDSVPLLLILIPLVPLLYLVTVLARARHQTNLPKSPYTPIPTNTMANRHRTARKVISDDIAAIRSKINRC